MEINKKDRFLLICESPNKVKSITAILKELGYKNIIVQASVGHITEINNSGVYNMGIDPDNDFDIDYVVSSDKKDTVKKLKDQVSYAKGVILATDPDREGEAISWSLKKFLKIPDDKYIRITYHEITKNAIEKALNNARTIDDDLVEAAHARACLDKIVGFRLSPAARMSIGAKSVGRCQSAGLKLIVDREREINDFNPETYYELVLNFKKNKSELKAKYAGTKDEEVTKLKTKVQCNNIINSCKGKDFIISDIVKKNTKQNSPLPFTTSTFQQEVNSKLGISVKDSMSYAQKLFEGIELNGKHVALITYIRTDDPVISDDFVPEIKKYVLKNYGEEYYQGPQKVKKKENVQAGHEAIRAVDLSMTPDKLSDHVKDTRMLKVYTLIYNRTIACMMSPREIADTQYVIANGDNLFKFSSKEETFDGWKAIYSYADKEEIVKETFKKKEKLEKTKLDIDEKSTQPPTRYNEATLIKTLDKLGIGRPSTYATIVGILLDTKRGYCKIEDKRLVPTPIAFKLTEFLEKNFNEIVDSSYSANLEKDLDKISSGKMKRVKFLTDFYKSIDDEVKKISPDKITKRCPECGSELIYRKGRYGLFIGCSNYPACKHIEKIPKKSSEQKKTTTRSRKGKK